MGLPLARSQEERVESPGHGRALPCGALVTYLSRMDARVRFENVSFRYPEDDSERDVLAGVTVDLPGGVISLIGQNGSGKTTFLMLAGGVLLPTRGQVSIRGRDTAGLRDEEERHRLVSIVYQNLEFETEKPIGDLLEIVFAGGFHQDKGSELIRELVDVFELRPFLGRKTQEVSKGELQRTILAFSLLYGSPILLMDEPIFALEDHQKEKVMTFLCSYVKRNGLCLAYSAHELDLSQKHSDYLLLFPPGAHPQLGPTREMFTREKIEKAYEVPFVMLRHKEELFRQRLIEADRERRGGP